jgi:hypothetical protein
VSIGDPEVIDNFLADVKHQDVGIARTPKTESSLQLIYSKKFIVGETFSRRNYRCEVRSLLAEHTLHRVNVPRPRNAHIYFNSRLRLLPWNDWMTAVGRKQRGNVTIIKTNKT